MGKLSEGELKRLIKGGETNTIELKVAVPRATEMAERLCGMANAQGGVIIIGVSVVVKMLLTTTKKLESFIDSLTIAHVFYN